MTERDLNKAYVAASLEREDAAVTGFLAGLEKGRVYSWLEAGAGLGRFAGLVDSGRTPIKASVTCLEINPDLVAGLRSKGLKTVAGSVENLPFPDASFDIVHASHLIEHFGYPAVVNVLDELFRVAKPGGRVIVRSPLMHSGFWNDIDHVRPYPPKCIVQYFDHAQQQRKGRVKVTLEKEWLRVEAVHVNNPNLPGAIAAAANRLFIKAWLRFGYPRGRANGYVAVFRKLP